MKKLILDSVIKAINKEAFINTLEFAFLTNSGSLFLKNETVVPRQLYKTHMKATLRLEFSSHNMIIQRQPKMSSIQVIETKRKIYKKENWPF